MTQSDKIKLNRLTPPAPSNARNVGWQAALDVDGTMETSAHMPVVDTTDPGLCPKLPADATKFLNGQGGFTTPPYPPSVRLQTGGVDNALQSKLNMIAGSNVTLTPDALGGVTIAAAGGSGGGGVMRGNVLDVPPSAPSQWDDEFEAGALNASWSVAASQATVSWDVPSHLKAKYGAANGWYMISKPFAPGSADFSVTMAASVAPYANYQTVVLSLGETAQDGGTNSHQLNYGFSGSSPMIRCDKTVSSVKTQGSVLGFPTGNQSRIYLHLQRVGGLWKAGYSFQPSGVLWAYTGWTPANPTVNYINVIANQYGATVPIVILLDWVRVNCVFMP